MVVSHRVDAGTRTQDLWKSSWNSQPLSHPCNPPDLELVTFCLHLQMARAPCKYQHPVYVALGSRPGPGVVLGLPSGPHPSRVSPPALGQVLVVWDLELRAPPTVLGVFPGCDGPSPALTDMSVPRSEESLGVLQWILLWAWGLGGWPHSLSRPHCPDLTLLLARCPFMRWQAGLLQILHHWHR